MPRPFLPLRLCILVAAALVLAACGTDDADTNGSPDTEQPPTDAEDEAPDIPAGGEPIAVTSFNFPESEILGSTRKHSRTRATP